MSLDPDVRRVAEADPTWVRFREGVKDCIKLLPQAKFGPSRTGSGMWHLVWELSGPPSGHRRIEIAELRGGGEREFGGKNVIQLSRLEGHCRRAGIDNDIVARFRAAMKGAEENVLLLEDWGNAFVSALPELLKGLAEADGGSQGPEAIADPSDHSLPPRTPPEPTASDHGDSHASAFPFPEHAERVRRLRAEGATEREHEDAVKQLLILLGHGEASIRFQVGRVDVLATGRDQKPRVVVEVKRRLDLAADRRDAIRKGFDYANRTGAPLVVLSDADRYEVYDRRRGLTLHAQLIGAFRVTVWNESDVQTLNALRAE